MSFFFLIFEITDEKKNKHQSLLGVCIQSLDTPREREKLGQQHINGVALMCISQRMHFIADPFFVKRHPLLRPRYRAWVTRTFRPSAALGRCTNRPCRIASKLQQQQQ